MARGRSTTRNSKPIKRVAFGIYCLFVACFILWSEFRLVEKMKHAADDEERLSSTTVKPLFRHESAHIREGKTSDSIKIIDKNVVSAKNGLAKPVLKATSVNTKKPPPPTYSPQDFRNCTLLQPDDTIYQYGPWDGSPIVVESHKLVFFTVPKVGCTVFKQLFRRMEGYEDWRKDKHPLPHAPKRNGLQYLYDYPPSVADQMMTDPSWTRAIFVRNPKERLLSAYLDKGTQNQYLQFHCCPGNKHNNKKLYKKLECSKRRKHGGPSAAQADQEEPFLSFDEFLRLLLPACQDPHWQSQADRIDQKYWPYINFVGHMESIDVDTRKLLEHINAWEDYGKDGWPNGHIFAGSATVSHATDSSAKVKDYFTEEIESVADSICEREYSIPILNLTKQKIVLKGRRAER